MKKAGLNIKTRQICWGTEAVALPDPPPVRQVRGERYENLPLFDDRASGWKSGRRLLAVQACECTLPGALVPGSVRVKTDQAVMKPDSDFRVNEIWGTVGRLPEGRIMSEEQVRISYSFYPSRIDTVIGKDGKLSVIIGKEGMAHPAIPSIPKNAIRIANIFWHGDCSKLSSDWFYPVTETAFPAGLLPESNIFPEKTLRKLRAGQPVRILVWGDSVTECRYLPQKSRWQEQFRRRLQAKYPDAEIELLTEGWGGRTTSSFFAVPSGEPHNFEENVLAPKPDLIISEFVNDCGLPLENLQANYTKAEKAFRETGAEWIILTPHYTRPDWMGLNKTKYCDDDPRPCVKFLREFTAAHRIPLADTARYWGRLYRQGIPYGTLYSNGINHPLEYGLSLFADALMTLF